MTRTICACAVTLLALSTRLSAAEPSYARPDLLVEPADLAKADASGKRVVLDARDRKKHEEERIPGAIWVDAPAWAKAFGDGKDAAGWSGRIGDLGITADSTVIVYDDALSKDAGRMWWILRYWGLSDVRLLNGGWGGWKAAGLPVEKGTAAAPKPVTLKLSPRAEMLSTKDAVLQALKDKKLQIIDSRSEAEFCGTEKLAKRGGAIPGAKHLEWVEMLDKKTGRFKSASEIRALLASAGIDPAKPAVTHCQTGGRASVMVFAMELVGAKDVRNYYASWAEWGNAEDTPVEPGKP